jgi:hypothetical protein
MTDADVGRRFRAVDVRSEVLTVAVWDERAMVAVTEPPPLVLNEPGCYHFHAFDPRLPLRYGFRGLMFESRPGSSASSSFA